MSRFLLCVRCTRLALFCMALASSAALAATATGPDGLDDEEVTSFLTRLQDAVRADEPKAFASLLNLPLRVNYAVKGQRNRVSTVRVATIDRFARDYTRIFTPRVKAAVLAQSSDKLFRNAQGVMIGDGEVWYAGVCRDKKCSAPRIGVIAVNVDP
jgi:hypothetical protein